MIRGKTNRLTSSVVFWPAFLLALSILPVLIMIFLFPCIFGRCILFVFVCVQCVSVCGVDERVIAEGMLCEWRERGPKSLTNCFVLFVDFLGMIGNVIVSFIVASHAAA